MVSGYMVRPEGGDWSCGEEWLHAAYPIITRVQNTIKNRKCVCGRIYREINISKYIELEIEGTMQYKSLFLAPVKDWWPSGTNGTLWAPEIVLLDLQGSLYFIRSITSLFGLPIYFLHFWYVNLQHISATAYRLLLPLWMPQEGQNLDKLEKLLR